MQTIRLTTNKRYIRLGMDFCLVFFGLTSFLFFAYGFRMEHGIGSVVSAAVAIYSYAMLKDNRPKMEITAAGFMQRLPAGNAWTMWENVSEIRWKTIGRRTQVIAVKTSVREVHIVYSYIAIDPNELMEILSMLAEMPGEDRDDFIRYVKNQRQKRGIHS